MGDNDIDVSVLLIAYNHSKYISRALQSVLRQKTDYNVEIIVHDDASTDNTQDIIRKFEKSNPGKLKAIYETENQLSKGTDIIEDIIFPLIRGRYVAELECDDEWIDENKLQKQVRFLEEHIDYIACSHNTLILDYEQRKIRLLNKHKKSYDVKLKDIIENSRSSFHLNSIVCRREGLKKLREFNNVVEILFGDLTERLCLLECGKIRYMPDVMSIYRRNSGPDAFTTKTKGSKSRIALYKKVIKLYRFLLNRYPNYKDSMIIRKYIRQYELYILLEAKKYRKAFTWRYFDIVLENGPVFCIGLFLKSYMPKFYVKVKQYERLYRMRF